MALQDAIGDHHRRRALLRDGIVELEAELQVRRGPSGVALRAGLRTVRRLRPDFLEDNLERMLPKAAPVLDHHHARAGDDVSDYFQRHADVIAGELVAIVDERADAANNRVAIGLYRKLRPHALDNVAAGMPRLARLVQTHA